MRFSICCSLSEAAQKKCNIGAQQQSLRCTTAPKIFWKIYFLYDFWCAQTSSFRGIFGLPVRSLNLLSALLYRCTFTFLALKYCSRFFLEMSQLSIWSGVQKFFCQFLDFSQFLTAISPKIVVPRSNGNVNYLACLKGQSLLKNAEMASKSTNKQWHKTCSKYTPSNKQRAGLGAWQKQTNLKHTNTIILHLQPARIVGSSPNFTWW